MTHTNILTTLVLASTLASGGAVFVQASTTDTVEISARTNVQHEPTAGSRTNDMRSLTRVAKRLQKRIERRFNQQPTLGSLRNAISVRRALLGRSISIIFRDEATAEDISAWRVSFNRYPEWMTFSMEKGPRFDLNEVVLAEYLAENPPDGLRAPSFARVTETRQDGKVMRGTVEGTVADGQLYDNDTVSNAVVQAFDYNIDEIVVPVQHVRGAVLYDDGTTTHVLHELGVGRSEFASSPWGRKQNVRKAMNEKANGIIIPSNATFSFNATLGGPITKSNGWLDSLIIVNGKDLEPAPGGGICQSATTVFRAAVAAGLPITARKSHSLYVHYYKEFGMGLDATVFPGSQDMTFHNDTSGPLVLLGMTDEYDNAYSTLYGIDDNRTVTLEGPFFGYTHVDPVMGRTLRTNEVAWIQHVVRDDGTTHDQLHVAQYKGLPRSVALEFQPVLHGAADLVADLR